MNVLGKSMAFYLRYFQEMEALYIDKDFSLLEEREDQTGVKDMITKVGDLACEQAREFLIEASERVIQLFEETFNASVSSRKSDVESSWRIDIWYWPKGKRLKESTKKWQLVISLSDYEGAPSVICYLWIKGGLAMEKGLLAILGKKVVASSKKISANYGNVVIGVVPVPIGEGQDFEIEKESLLEETVRCFSKLSKEEIGEILSL
jgi:hypothetical protein